MHAVRGHALDVPQLKYHVNDYANMMSPETRSKIEGDLKAFEQSDSTQVVILTIPVSGRRGPGGVLHQGCRGLENRTEGQR